PTSVVYPNRNTHTDTIHPPTPGSAASNASATAAVLVWPERYAPVTKIDSAEMLDVTNDTVNTSMTALSPCVIGSRLIAVPYATAAVPYPASFAYTPRARPYRIPTKMASVPPAVARNENASRTTSA